MNTNYRNAKLPLCKENPLSGTIILIRQTHFDSAADELDACKLRINWGQHLLVNTHYLNAIVFIPLSRLALVPVSSGLSFPDLYS